MTNILESDGSIQPSLNITAPAPSLDLKGFHWQAVDDPISSPAVDGHLKQQSRIADEGKFGLEAEVLPGSVDRDPLSEQLRAQLHIGEPSRGDPPWPLQHFKGAYAGSGFSLIFRPRASRKQGTRDAKDEGETVKERTIQDNTLQIGFTREQITFGAQLGEIPNRGFKEQGDINLAGLPYMQTVQNTTNPKTAELSVEKEHIHFEPGVWLFAPSANIVTSIVADSARPDTKFPNNDTIVRMASIPHGTTINAQGVVPRRNLDSKSIIGGFPGKPELNGKPDFEKADKADARPFGIGTAGEEKDRIHFNSMKTNIVANPDLRIPPNVGNMKDKRMEPDHIDNPNLFLRDALAGLEVLEVIAFTVDTKPSTGLTGGGVTNITFLTGKQDPPAPVTKDATGKQGAKVPEPTFTQPVARASSMNARYWIEVVNYPITVPEMKPFGVTETLVAPVMPNAFATFPQFKLQAGPKGEAGGRQIKVPGIQIQTSQTVLLDFGTLSWPHISVSTVVPKEQPVVDLTKFPSIT